MLNASSLLKNVTWNQTLLILLDRCKSMSELKQIQSVITTLGLSQDDSFASRLLSFSALSDSGDADYSHSIFSRLDNPTTFNWNTIIRGYSKSRNPNKSFSLFVQMLQLSAFPDHLTYPFLAKASARLLEVKPGRVVHVHVVKNGYELDMFIQNSLIHMYASCGEIVCSRKMFDEMPNRNLVSWNSILDGYAKCGDMVSAREVFEFMPESDVVSWSSLIGGYMKAGEYKEALGVFGKMWVSGPMANEVTMVSVLCACAHLGVLEMGRVIHHHMIANGLPLTLALQTSLVDMYAKCGAIDEASVVFNAVRGKKTDVLIWNAMIGGLASHGLVKESLELFTEMQITGIRPDEITYLCLLSACTHGGLVKEALHFLDSLGKHGMSPKIEHYACAVDAFSRAGKLEEAHEFLCRIPLEPTGSMLGALLSGCVGQGNLDLAEIVGRRLIELEPDHDGRYIGLSNAYAVVKRWDDARTMREAMDRRKIKKCPGRSSVEVSGSFRSFLAHDRTHPESDEIYFMLNHIIYQMRIDVFDEKQEELFYVSEEA